MNAYQKQATLTTREMDVLLLLATGEDRKTIAEKLYISTHAAKARAQSLRGKLGANTSAQAVYKAMKLDILT